MKTTCACYLARLTANAHCLEVAHDPDDRPMPHRFEHVSGTRDCAKPAVLPMMRCRGKLAHMTVVDGPCFCPLVVSNAKFFYDCAVCVDMSMSEVESEDELPATFEWRSDFTEVGLPFFHAHNVGL